jgi:hypothetical protein
MITNLDEIIKQAIQPLLKLYNFKKKGLQWNRERGEFVDVITVQKASYSTLLREVFTLNLGLAVPEFRKIIWPEKQESSLSEAECVVRVRLGDLLQGKPFGDAIDHWWELEKIYNNAEQTGRQIEEALINFGIPFLEQFDTFNAIVAHIRLVMGWQSKIPLNAIYRALAEWKSGLADTALETLANIKSKAWENKAEIIRAIIKPKSVTEDRW